MIWLTRILSVLLYIGKSHKIPLVYPQFQIENNAIFKFIPSIISIMSNNVEWKLVVPKQQREEVISSCHDPLVCSHFGFYKALRHIQFFYLWPKMIYDVFKYIRFCKMCQTQKMPNSQPLGLMGSQK